MSTIWPVENYHIMGWAIAAFAILCLFVVALFGGPEDRGPLA